MKKLLIVCAVLLVLPCIAVAQFLPDTGQTKCYDDVGNELNPCPQPGEPFYGQDAQYPCNPQSYTQLDENGHDMPFSPDYSTTPWAMVRDNITGLIWEIKEPLNGTPDYNNPHDADNTYTWYDSNPATNGGDAGTPGNGTDTEDFINALNASQFGGHYDWKLPTAKELSNIANSSILHTSPTINTDYFPTTVSSYYSTSTTYAHFPVHSWGVWFNYGIVYFNFKEVSAWVRAVRGEQTTNIFIDNGDWTITDMSTGLMWEVKTDDEGPRDKDDTYTWKDALEYCENLTLATYDDWRLPDKNELHSIVDYSRWNPSIDTTFFDNTLPSNYWSSTTYTGDPNNAYDLWFGGGSLSAALKSLNFSVRAVRGGHCGVSIDSDEDGVYDDDNCPQEPNGPLGGTCTSGALGEPCLDHSNCGLEGFCSMNQEDTDDDGLGDICDNCPNTPNPSQDDNYPPKGNGIGDACDCEGDFNCDGNVDATDVDSFLANFGRTTYFYPCSNVNPCDGDFNCDVNVDALDVNKFLEDFGRSQFNNPCPPCVAGPWCVYQ